MTVRPPETLGSVSGDLAPGNAHHISSQHQDIAHQTGMGVSDAELGLMAGVRLFDMSGFHDSGMTRNITDSGNGNACTWIYLSMISVLSEKGERGIGKSGKLAALTLRTHELTFLAVLGVSIGIAPAAENPVDPGPQIRRHHAMVAAGFSGLIQSFAEPAAGTFGTHAAVPVWHDHILVVLAILQICLADGTEIVDTGNVFGTSARLLQSGQQHSCQNGDDGDYDQ